MHLSHNDAFVLCLFVQYQYNTDLISIYILDFLDFIFWCDHTHTEFFKLSWLLKTYYWSITHIQSNLKLDKLWQTEHTQATTTQSKSRQAEHFQHPRHSLRAPFQLPPILQGWLPSWLHTLVWPAIEFYIKGTTKCVLFCAWFTGLEHCVCEIPQRYCICSFYLSLCIHSQEMGVCVASSWTI